MQNVPTLKQFAAPVLEWLQRYVWSVLVSPAEKNLYPPSFLLTLFSLHIVAAVAVATTATDTEDTKTKRFCYLIRRRLLEDQINGLIVILPMGRSNSDNGRIQEEDGRLRQKNWRRQGEKPYDQSVVHPSSHESIMGKMLMTKLPFRQSLSSCRTVALP